MPNPWEKYATEESSGPWAKYASKELPESVGSVERFLKGEIGRAHV